MNKFVHEGVGVYVHVLDPSCAGPTCGHCRPVFTVVAHLNTTPRVGRDVPTQTIILTPSQPVGL